MLLNISFLFIAFILYKFHIRILCEIYSYSTPFLWQRFHKMHQNKRLFKCFWQFLAAFIAFSNFLMRDRIFLGMPLGYLILRFAMQSSILDFSFLIWLKIKKTYFEELLIVYVYIHTDGTKPYFIILFLVFWISFCPWLSGILDIVFFSNKYMVQFNTLI